MTPKEKAKDLVEKYYQSYDDNDVYGDYTNGPKDGALIAVDEILDEFRKLLPFSRGYWQQVRTEIENL